MARRLPRTSSGYKMSFAEIGLVQNGPTTLFVDSHAAIRLAENPSSPERSRHINIMHHIIRERVEMGDIALEYTSTAKPAHGPSYYTVRRSAARCGDQVHTVGKAGRQGRRRRGSVTSIRSLSLHIKYRLRNTRYVYEPLSVPYRILTEEYHKTKPNTQRATSDTSRLVT